ncbi:restriction endonuclease subunit S [bacterium]|nr:restriction endonuclease subunit S [bacterium]
MSKGEFKDSLLDRIPPGWEIKFLGELSKNNGDYGSGAAALEFNPDFPRYVRITDIMDDGKLDPNSLASVNRKDAEGYYLKSNDLLFARTGATVGKTYLYDESDGECAHAGYVIKFSLDSNLCAPSFVSQWTRSDFYWAWVQQTLRHGAQPNINAQEYKSVKLLCPPLDEQYRITEILYTADEAIQQTEAVIAKLKQIKAGLLHDLLTCGLDEHGKLRDPIAHPEQFKDSPLGRIPKEWEVGTIQKLALNCDNRRIPLKQEDRDKMQGIYPYYGASGIIDMVDDYIFDGEYVLLGEDGENVVSRQLPLAFRASGKFWVNNHAHIYKPLPGVNIRFLTELLEAKDYKPIISGSAQPKLTQHAINKLLFQIPLTAEQKRIAKVLNAHDTRIRAEEAYRDKLKQQKKGLMYDLLTGRVRV